MRIYFGSKYLIDYTIFLFVLFITYFLSLYYVNGDQFGYGMAYKVVRGIAPSSAIQFYQDFISTQELGHFVFVYVFSNLSYDKNMVFSLLNGMSAVVIFRALRCNGAGLGPSLLLVTTNYYLYVLWLSAERLKIAILLLLCGIYVVKRTSLKLFLIVAAVFSHITVCLLFLGAATKKTIIFCREWRFSYFEMTLLTIFFVITICVFLYIFGDYIMWKSRQYFSFDFLLPQAILPMIFYFSFSYFYAENRNFVIVDFFLIFLAFLLFGGSRVNMFAYFIFLKYAVGYKNGNNIAVCLTSIYFSWKTMIYISNVINTGQGF